MRTIAAVSTLALLVAAPAIAQAADVYAPSGLKDGPVVVNPGSWTGFYIGINGGYGANSDALDTAATAIKDHAAILDVDGSTVIRDAYTRTATYNVAGAEPSGFLYGVQAGYLFQTGGFVIGAEFAFDGSSIAGSKASEPDINVARVGGRTDTDTGIGVAAMHQQLDYIGTLTGVVGLPFGSVMPYVKGGFAFGQVQDTVAFAGWNNDGVIINKTATDTGWTVGAGLAWKFAPNWSLGLEYDYYDLGSRTLSYTDKLNDVKYNAPSIPETFWAFKTALNYQVSSNYVPLK